MKLFLRKFTLNDEPLLKAAISEFSVEPGFVFAHQFAESKSMSEYIRYLDELQRGIGLEPSHVPCTVLYAFVGDKIVGRTSIRHRLNDFLSRIGGHIGYGVVPSERRKGYASQILKHSLIVSRNLGLDRVLLTCDDDNIGSIKTIESNSGILTHVYTGAEVTKPKRHYWIELKSSGEGSGT